MDTTGFCERVDLPKIKLHSTVSFAAVAEHCPLCHIEIYSYLKNRYSINSWLHWIPETAQIIGEMHDLVQRQHAHTHH